MTRTGLLNIVTATALALQPLLATAGTANQIGVTAAVLPDATGTPPNRELRVLQIGVDMFANERIETGPDGKTQLVFLDGTALSIGPNSDLTLDEFVYDPASKTGNLVMSSTKGVFRLVGGAISKKTPITITTPNATIGIRGGIALVSVAPDGGVDASFLFGIGLTVTTPGGDRQVVDRPGSAVAVRPGQPVQVSMAASPQLAQTLGKLEGNQAQPAPTATPKVQDADIAGSQIGSLASQQAPTAGLAVQPKGGPAKGKPGLTAGGSPGPGGPMPLQGLLSPLPGLNDQQKLLSPTGKLADPTIAGSLAVGGPGLFGGLFVTGDPVIGEPDPQAASGFFDPGRYRPFNNVQLVDGLFLGAADGQPIRLPLQPGNFNFGPSAAGGTQSPIGPVGGTAYISDDLAFAYYSLINGNGDHAAVFGGVPSTGQGAPLQAFELQPGFPNPDGIPFLIDGFGGDIPLTETRPLFWVFNPAEAAFAGPSTRSVWGTVAISGNGPAQRSAIVGALAKAFFDPALNKDVFGGGTRGFARDGGFGAAIGSVSGNAVVADGNGVWSFGAKGIGTENFVTSSDLYLGNGREASQVSANLFNQPVTAREYQQQVAWAMPVPNGVGLQRTARNLAGFAGGLADVRDPLAPGSPISTVPLVNRFGAPTSLTLITNPNTNSVFMQLDLVDPQFGSGRVELFFGNLSNSGTARSGFVDDAIFGMAEASNGDPLPGGGTVPGAGGRLLGSDNAKVDGVAMTNYFWNDRNAVPPGVTICGCGFMSWGFWAADVVPSSAGSTADAFRATLAGFVAGELPAVGAIPGTGTATYAGHAMANIRNAAGAQYTAFGSFQQTWDFSQRTGTLTIGNLDGATYAATLGSPDGRELTGSIAGVSPGATDRAGSFAGAFFRSGTDAVAGVGGSFFASGNDGYRAAGIVVGKR